MIRNLSIYSFILFIIFNSTFLLAKEARIAIAGFKPFNEKTEYISEACNDFLNQNLINAGYVVTDNKNAELEMLIIKTDNLFLASRELSQTDSLLSFTISGKYKFSGKNISLYIELYSAEKKRILLKKEFNGKKNHLLTFYENMTRNILSIFQNNYRPQNIFAVDEDKILADYLKILKYQKAADYERMADLLDMLTPYFKKHPLLKQLHDQALAKNSKEKVGPFQKPFRNITKLEVSDDTEAEAYLRKTIAKGYRFVYKTANIKELEDDSAKANVVVNFELLFKNIYRKMLLKESKKRKGDDRFNNMGRYYFSDNADENEQFVELLLKQKMKLSFFDKEGKELFTSDEIEVKIMTYDGGGYRNSKTPPFPIMPKGPASNNAYSLFRKVEVFFMVEEIEVEKINNIAYSEVGITFED